LLLAHIKAFFTFKKDYEQLASRVYRELHNVSDPTPAMIRQTARSFRMADIRKWVGFAIALALVILAAVWDRLR
jgi:hypothetical protein